MRLFVAIPLPDDVREHIATLQRTLPDQVRRVNPDQAHITLAFLGDTDPVRVEKRLGSVRFSPFQAVLDRIGGFPNLSQPRVLYIGGPPRTEAIELAEQVNTALAHEPDRPFRLHATIGRIKQPVTFDFSKLRTKEFVFTVRKFVLYSSERKPHGPVYTEIETFTAR